MKYMIMTFGSAEEGLATMGKDWMIEMIQFMKNLDDDLRKSGEMVSNAGAQADQAQKKLEQIDQVALVPQDIQTRREAIAVKLKAARQNELPVFLRISGSKSSGNDLVDSLNLLEDARTAEALDTFCTRMSLTVPSAGGC